MWYDITKTEEERKNILNYIHLFYKKKFDLEFFDYQFKIDEEGMEHTFGTSAPLPYGFKYNSKVSNRKVQSGIKWGDSKANASLFFMYDKIKKQPAIGAEINAMNIISADAIAKYDYERDVIDFKHKLELCFFGIGAKLDLVHAGIKDVAHNTIGKGLDILNNNLTDVINHISPQFRSLNQFNEELRDQSNNTENIGDLNNVIRKVGDYEMAKDSIKTSYHIHYAEFNYLNNLDDRVKTNTRNIEINKNRLDNNERILGQQDKTLGEHSEILDRQENKLNIHDQLLAEHSHILAN